ncbi:MAG TPA: DUF3047 domain-containing protein, partial [Ramlibacter sp.]|nr:DUF3047 domain-containing protein [Ramlibacter sp.]
TPAGPEAIASSPWARQSSAHAGPQAAWKHKTLPGKRPTEFRYARHAGRDAVRVQADGSASLLRQQLRIEPHALGRLHFSWKVPALMAQADLGLREADDAPVRIVLAFEGDRSRFSARDAALAELVHMLTGEQMPYATLMYAWGTRRQPGSVVLNPRTGRIRTLVVESGAGGLDRWLDYARDIRADFERAFGEPPGALVGVALMTDSDNTRSRIQAWYGPLRLEPPPRAQP